MILLTVNDTTHTRDKRYRADRNEKNPQVEFNESSKKRNKINAKLIFIIFYIIQLTSIHLR